MLKMSGILRELKDNWIVRQDQTSK
jgi:hypothetical protein